MAYLEACKTHGGPITESDLDRLDPLTYEQLVDKIGYLKRTKAPRLRFKRKSEKKFVNYSTKKLRQLRDVIIQVNDSSRDINAVSYTHLTLPTKA